MSHDAIELLIVEDSAEDRELYRRLLQQDPDRNYTFTEADCGEAGLERYKAAQPDAILLDYLLPDLDGMEFLDDVAAAMPQSVRAPIIFLTGHGDENIVAEAMRAGAVDYLSKGRLSTKSLSRAVNNAVDKHRLQQRIQEQQQTLEKTNRELVRRNEEIQRFYHHLSHELKTPLTSAREFVSILLDGLGGALTEAQTEYLNYIKESCDQITVGLNDLLDATRLDTGKLHITPQAHTIDHVIEYSLAALQPVAKTKDITLRRSIDGDLPLVFIDHQRISQVLNNLLTNACKFTPPKGQVTVSATAFSQSTDMIQIAVADTGRGIAADELSHIFDRLHQVQHSDAASEGGLGLGLYICQELVRLHGGEMSVTSTLGKGSTFCFTLPTAAAETHHEAKPVAASV